MARPRIQGSNGVDYGGAHAKNDYRNHGKSSSSVGYILGASVVSVALIAGMGVVTANTMDNMRDHAASMRTATAAIGDTSSNPSSENTADGLNGAVDAKSDASASSESTSSASADSHSASSASADSASSSSSSASSSSEDSASKSESAESSVASSGAESSDARGSESSGSKGTESTKRTPEEVVVVDGERIYHIHYGDTLSGISDQTGVSVQKIAHTNEIDDVNLIYADSALVIPD